MSLVYSAALRQLGGDTHLAQDVTQEVFTALARKADRLVGRVTLAGWLYLGTHHAVAQTIRSVRRRRSREQEAAGMMLEWLDEPRAARWIDAAVRAIP